MSVYSLISALGDSKGNLTGSAPEVVAGVELRLQRDCRLLATAVAGAARGSWLWRAGAGGRGSAPHSARASRPAREPPLTQLGREARRLAWRGRRAGWERRAHRGRPARADRPRSAPGEAFGVDWVGATGLTLRSYAEAATSSTLALDGAEASRDKWGAFKAPAPSLGRNRPRVPSAGAGSQHPAAEAAGVFPPCARSRVVSAGCRSAGGGPRGGWWPSPGAALPGRLHPAGKPRPGARQEALCGRIETQYKGFRDGVCAY